jgi:hypothetical protein
MLFFIKEQNLIVEKWQAFALPALKLYWRPVETKRAYKLSGQVSLSGTATVAEIKAAM